MPPEIPLPQPEPALPATQGTRRGPVRRYGPGVALLTTTLVGIASLVTPGSARASGASDVIISERCEPGQAGIIAESTYPYSRAGGEPFYIKFREDSQTHDGIPDTAIVRPWPAPDVPGTVSLEGVPYRPGENAATDATVTLVNSDRRTSAVINSNPDEVHVIVQCRAPVQPPPSGPHRR